jgi:hypothetical protein
MRQLRDAASRGFNSVSRAIRQQPDYHSEVSNDYLNALEAQVGSQKPENFALIPISEPGW